MPGFKLQSIIILSAIVFSCGSNTGQKKNEFSIVSNTKGNSISNDAILTLSIKNLKNYVIDSTVFWMDGKRISNNQELNPMKLGDHSIKATVYFEGRSQNATLPVTILNSFPPKVYDFTIINEYPHDITSYTQGLEFYNGELYESTGQYGESKLRKLDYRSGAVLKNVNLDRQYFGEGLTILDSNIYQLTWRENTGLIYDVNTFERKGNFNYEKSKEGWGLCNDDEVIYKSDGTEKIWTLNPESLREQEYIQTFTNKGKIVGMNELEWVNGKIYANRYQLDGVAIINPQNGAIEGVIDFRSLKKKVTRHPGLDVLNGIAWNPETKTLFVTGKRWDKLFEVEIIEK